MLIWGGATAWRHAVAVTTPPPTLLPQHTLPPPPSPPLLLLLAGKAGWIAGTTFLILVVPLIIEMDREQQVGAAAVAPVIVRQGSAPLNYCHRCRAPDPSRCPPPLPACTACSSSSLRTSSSAPWFSLPARQPLPSRRAQLSLGTARFRAA